MQERTPWVAFRDGHAFKPQPMRGAWSAALLLGALVAPAHAQDGAATGAIVTVVVVALVVFAIYCVYISVYVVKQASPAGARVRGARGATAESGPRGCTAASPLGPARA